MASKLTDRLKRILDEDRKVLSPKSERDLRKKLAAVLSQYFPIDKRKLHIRITRTQYQTAYELIADMPIKRSELEKDQ
ncbi:MAG TPA: cell division topological specificity factor MinE [Caldisericia bacterium]|mgnify:CR=1 FL=1|jgi:cell division topological specificity factor MinE|nr:cell division topological specificity factor MinE [Caldisericia bacterium]HXK50963.1 cell division topological specificity factor MinE [Caldisericia bacterium]